MDLFPFLAPSRPGAPSVGAQLTADSNATAQGLVGNLAAFLAVFVVRIPEKGGGDGHTSMTDAPMGDIAGRTFLNASEGSDAAESDATEDGASTEPAAAMPTVTVAPAIAPAQVVESSLPEARDKSAPSMTPQDHTVPEGTALGQQVRPGQWSLSMPPVPALPRRGDERTVRRTDSFALSPGAVAHADGDRKPGRNGPVPNATAASEERPPDTGVAPDSRALARADATVTIRRATQDADMDPAAVKHSPSGAPSAAPRATEPAPAVTMPLPASSATSIAADAVLQSRPIQIGQAPPVDARVDAPSNIRPLARPDPSLAPVGQGRVLKDEQAIEHSADSAPHVSKPDRMVAAAPFNVQAPETIRDESELASGPNKSGRRASPAALEGARPSCALVAETISRPVPSLEIETGSSTLADVSAITASPDTGQTPRAEHRTASVTHTLPLGLGQRLAETVAQFPDRPVEVTLSPEELGRVRMSLTTHDGALTMNVVADRPETLDLLRRNIDQLAQDFRDLGFRDLSFSFGDRSAGQSPEHLPEDTATETESETITLHQPARHPHLTATLPEGGLDLRL